MNDELVADIIEEVATLNFAEKVNLESIVSALIMQKGGRTVDVPQSATPRVSQIVGKLQGLSGTELALISVLIQAQSGTEGRFPPR